MNQTGRETGTTGSCGRNHWNWQLRTVITALLRGSLGCFIPTGGRGGGSELSGGPTTSIPGENVPSLPSLQDLRKVSVESISFLILIRASSTMGPHLQHKPHITDPAEPTNSGCAPAPTLSST